MLPRFSITTTLLLLALSPGIVSERSFVVDHKDNCFRKDGQKYQFISGSMHYYRYNVHDKTEYEKFNKYQLIIFKKSTLLNSYSSKKGNK